ncbi:MAG: PEP-utilizing enzyme [archaeon]
MARELSLPCVVGTGNATEAIRDGDRVIVDADKGIVRIVSRAK